MTFWTYFFIVAGVVFFTVQFARLIDLIERPGTRSHTGHRDSRAA